MMEVSRSDLQQLVLAVASLCDSLKRMERAVLTGDHSYIEEAKGRREAAERSIERISARMGGA